MVIIPSFNQLIEERVIKGWEQPALSDYQGDTFRYCDVAQSINHLHIVYAEMGICPGDRIALCSPNCARWGIAFLSILTFGAIPVPILSDFNAEQLQNIVTHSEAKLLFIADNIYKQIGINNMPLLEGVLKMEDYSLLESRSESLVAIYKRQPALHRTNFPHDMKKEDVRYYREKSFEDLAMINYTSGTTGFSKGVMLPYRALWSNYDFALQAIGNAVKPGDQIISLLPMAHMYGMMFEFVFEFIYGCHVHFFTKTPSPALIAKAFAEIHPRVVIAVPLILEKMVKKKILPQLQQSKVAKYMKWPVVGFFVRRVVRKKVLDAFGGNVLEVIVGGAPFNQTVEAFLCDIGFPLAIGYGATECAPIITYRNRKLVVPGSCGKIVPHMELKINSSNPHKIPGEILVRGLNVMLGYYKNEEATRAVLDDEGWYHTGDLGVVDLVGNLYIKGRIKNMILGPSGQNIYPEEIEDKLNSMLMVSESIIIKREDKLVALVYPDYEEACHWRLKDENIKNIMQLNKDDLNKMLPAYEHIQRMEVQEDEFEKTPKKSIKRYLYK